MEEKRLTDEEIVKALECCGSGHAHDSCDRCPLNGVKDCYNTVLNDYALDLIHRLQGENKRLAELEDKIEQGTLIELPCILKPYYLCGEWHCKILFGFDQHSVPIMGYFYGKDEKTALRKAEKRLKELQNG